MRRLNWLESGGEQTVPIVDLIEQYPLMKQQGPVSIPPMNQAHPKYQTYKKLGDLEKETFIRKQIPEAIDEFGRSLGD
jgi:hypothetical protein